MKSSPRNVAHLTKERGVALIIVTMLVALASILVVNLAYSTNLAANQSAAFQRSIQAEYLLKSAINLARVLLHADKSPEDSTKDLWGMFLNGAPIPLDVLGLPDNSIKIELEIRPEDSKLPLASLIPAGASIPDPKWRDAFSLLFQDPLLGFAQDKEEDHTGRYPQRIFTPEEMLGMLLDYMDADKESYVPGGIEGDGVLPEGICSNQPAKRLSELSVLPGFPPSRIRKLIPLISAISSVGGITTRVNINLAPSIVLRALHPRIDQSVVNSILAFRASEEGPFTSQNLVSKLSEFIGDQDAVNTLQTMVWSESRWFQVIAKVDYGTSLFFARAYISKGRYGDVPEIHSLELF
jgi:general secretion pathway protein K